MNTEQSETVRLVLSVAPQLLEICEAMAELMDDPHEWPDEMFEAFVPVEAIRKAHDVLLKIAPKS